ncbi:MAG: hypothetical protein ABL933_00500 [Methyloglobulus sp.]|nr:hypothetical protein [Methyloglobulus sp.]
MKALIKNNDNARLRATHSIDVETRQQPFQLLDGLTLPFWQHINRFGKYSLDLEKEVEPLSYKVKFDI